MIRLFFNHSGVGRVVLDGLGPSLTIRYEIRIVPFTTDYDSCFSKFVLVFFCDVLWSLDRCVDGVVGHHQQKQTVLVRLHVVNRIVGQAVGQIVAVISINGIDDGQPFFGREGKEVISRGTSGTRVDDSVEALITRDRRLPSRDAICRCNKSGKEREFWRTLVA